MSKYYAYTGVDFHVPLKVLLIVPKSFFYLVKVCYTIWTYLWICSSCWDTFPWICYYYWSCSYWSSLDDSLDMDDFESPGDSWGALWLPFSMESFKFHSLVWGVSVMFLSLDIIHWIYSTIVLIVKLCILIFRADFHDYHHRLLYTKSGNYSSTFTYMDWYVFHTFCSQRISLFGVIEIERKLYKIEDIALLSQPSCMSNHN